MKVYHTPNNIDTTNLSVTFNISQINVSGKSFRISGNCIGGALKDTPFNERPIATGAPPAAPPNPPPNAEATE